MYTVHRIFWLEETFEVHAGATFRLGEQRRCNNVMRRYAAIPRIVYDR